MVKTFICKLFFTVLTCLFTYHLTMVLCNQICNLRTTTKHLDLELYIHHIFTLTTLFNPLRIVFYEKLKVSYFGHFGQQSVSEAVHWWGERFLFQYQVYDMKYLFHRQCLPCSFLLLLFLSLILGPQIPRTK